MKNSLRLKFILGMSIILIISGTSLNILIRYVFQYNFENTIKTSMKDIMRNSREYIHYYLLQNDNHFNKDALQNEALNIIDYFQTSYSCEGEINDVRGKNIRKSISYEYNQIVSIGTREALNGKAVINIKYVGNDAYAILSYPLYYQDKCFGIINIGKSYSEFYTNQKNIISIISFTEISIFLLVFILSCFFTSKMIKPIMILTKEIKKVECGDYEVSLKIKSKDEIGILLKEFMKMKNKIKNQIDTINDEKDKVLLLEKGRREFFNNVTHELKTPLTAISGYAQILMENKVEDEEFKKRAVERIYLESERLHALVLDLISISKGATFIEEEIKKLDMRGIINTICDDMQLKSKKYAVALVRDIQEGYISGQENKIKQLIINIIDNAIKYSIAYEKVFIKAYTSEEFFIINVINKGEKIPNEIYNKIFEPFIKTKESSEKGSSGLGLYICHEIVKEHNGKISIENGDEIKVIIKIPSFGNNLETTDANLEKSK